MDDFFLNNFGFSSEIPRESLIDLLKSDRVTDFLLDWACQQCDQEIALAILINYKTSQQHLENLFETFDNYLLERYNPGEYFYDYDNNFYNYGDDRYIEYKDVWDILNNIENHINWEQRKLKGNWEKDIVYQICVIGYPDPYWNFYANSHLSKIVDFRDEIKIENLDYKSKYFQVYQRFIWQLRKLKKIPPKNKVSSQSFSVEAIQAKKAKNNNELEKFLGNKDSDFQIKFAILENSNITKKIFIKILDNVIKRQNYIQLLQDNRFDEAFAKYPKVANEFLENLFRKKNDKCNLFLAGYSHTSVLILEKLSQLCNIGILAKLAENPNTPEHILLKLLKQNHYDVIPKLRQNPNLPDHIAEQLPDINGNPLNWDIAYMDISVDDLKEIALTSNDYKERERIVYNPNTNNQILEILSNDLDYGVRYRVAATHGTPLHLLEKLAKDENEEVRFGVLSNPNLTKDIFYRLMPDIYGSCNYSLGRLLAFLDPNVSPKILEQNASSLLWNERFAIAVHPKTPKQTIEQLAKDGNIYVRAAASERNHDSTVF